MSERFEVVIVGGGVAGLATAWFLSQRPCGRIVVLEREAETCSCSSGLNAAILRTVGDDPWVTRLCLRSAERLRHPPAGFSTLPLTDPCGLIMVACGSLAGELESWVRGAGEDVRAERLTVRQARRLAPHYAGDVACAFRFPEEGRLDIAALCAGFGCFVPGSRVELRTRAAVREVLFEGDRAAGALLADGTEIRATTTVIAAGGWAGRLADTPVARSLRPTRRHLMVTEPDARVDPRWPVVWSLSEQFYCRPESGGMLMSACDEEAVDPDACRPCDAVCETIAEKAMRLTPGLADAGVAHFWCGMRTLTADHRFVIGPDPTRRGLFWVAGLGGHGMVGSFEIGRLAAETVIGEVSDERMAAAFSPSRFAGEGAPAAASETV